MVKLSRKNIAWGIFGFIVGWLMIYLQVYLLFNVGADLYLINGLWIGIGIGLYIFSIIVNWWGFDTSHYGLFVRIIAITMIANGLLYFTQLLV